MNLPANETDKWNAGDYAQNSSAQRAWADKLIAKPTLNSDETVLVLDIGRGDEKIAAVLFEGKNEIRAY